MKLFVRTIEAQRPPRVWKSDDGVVQMSLDTDGTGLAMTPAEAAALATSLLAAAGQPNGLAKLIDAAKGVSENIVLGGTHHGIECREALQAMGVV